MCWRALRAPRIDFPDYATDELKKVTAGRSALRSRRNSARGRRTIFTIPNVLASILLLFMLRFAWKIWTGRGKIPMIRLALAAATVMPCLGCASVTRGTTEKHFHFERARKAATRRYIRPRHSNSVCDPLRGS